MKSKAGNSVLWFLVGCLALIEATIGYLGNQFKDVEYIGYWLMVFAFLSLIAILASLLLMFFKDPQFLIAEKGQLGLISVFQLLAANGDAEFVKEFFRRMDPNQLISSQLSSVQESIIDDDSKIEDEQSSISEFLSKLKTQSESDDQEGT